MTRGPRQVVLGRQGMMEGQCSIVVLHNIVLHRNPKTSSAWQTGDDGGGRLSGKRASREAATGAN